MYVKIKHQNKIKYYVLKKIYQISFVQFQFVFNNTLT